MTDDDLSDIPRHEGILMPRNRSDWQRICAKHGLREPDGMWLVDTSTAGPGGYSYVFTDLRRKPAPWYKRLWWWVMRRWR